MDEETMAPIDELEALDAAEDEEQFGDAGGGVPSNNPTQCS